MTSFEKLAETIREYREEGGIELHVSEESNRVRFAKFAFRAENGVRVVWVFAFDGIDGLDTQTVYLNRDDLKKLIAEVL